MSEQQLLRIGDVCRKVGVSRPQVYKLMKTADFPRPVHLSARGRAWPADELDEWIMRKRAERDASAS